MHNARTILFAFALTTLILACGFGGAASTPSGDHVATVVASTIQAITPDVATAPPTPVEATPAGVPVNYKNISFTLPPGLAVDAAPEDRAAVTENDGPPWDTAPAHIEFRLDGYKAPANSFSVVRLAVYPAQEYAAANNGANISLQRLQGLLADPSIQPTNQNLPQVPSFNAASMFAAQIKRVDFQNGHGVRTVTQYGQAVGPAANNSIFYHFQGLTSDGKYFVIAVLPVQAPFLQNGNEPNAPVPAGGIPFPGYDNGSDPKVYEDYFDAVTAKLDTTPADQFSPSLATLDALVQSFTVRP